MEDEIKNALNQIKNKLTRLDVLREDVSRLMRMIENKESLAPRFVESSPTIRTYGGMIDRLLRHGIGKDLYVMGYFDQIMLDKLFPLARYVKIISPSGALKSKRNKDALMRMSKAGAKVRTHPMLHARLLCAPDRKVLIVGSGDLQTDCIGGTRFDAGIWSNYPDLIKSAIDFFNRVWEEAEPVPETSM